MYLFRLYCALCIYFQWAHLAQPLQIFGEKSLNLSFRAESEIRVAAWVASYESSYSQWLQRNYTLPPLPEMVLCPTDFHEVQLTFPLFRTFTGTSKDGFHLIVTLFLPKGKEGTTTCNSMVKLSWIDWGICGS